MMYKKHLNGCEEKILFYLLLPHHIKPLNGKV